MCALVCFLLAPPPCPFECRSVLCAQVYAPQTKILENGTTGLACVFDGLCDDVSTLFGLRTIATSSKTHARPVVPFHKIFAWDA